MNKRIIFSCITIIFLITCVFVSIKGLHAISNFKNSDEIISSENKNPVPETENHEDKNLKVLNKVNDKSSDYKKEVILELSYGKEENNLGIRKRNTDVGEVFDIPQAMDIDKNGNIYIADPVNNAIKVYSKEGRYLEKIEFNKNDILRDFGVDSVGNIFIIGEKKLYKKNFNESSFEDIVNDLNEPHEVVDSWNGNASVLDFSGLPDGNLRVQKFDSNGKILEKVEQNNFDFSMYEYEDLKGNKISFSKEGESLLGFQYKVSINASNLNQNQEFIYYSHLPDEYFYTMLDIIGCDEKDNMYMIRSIAPDLEDSVEAYKGEETWVDIINPGKGEINSVKLEKRKEYGGVYRTNHMYKVDTKGNIYQMQSDAEKVRIIKYSINE